MINFPNGNSPQIDMLISFNDWLLTLLFPVSVLIVYVLLSITNSKYSHRNLVENQSTETMWTILPAFILIFLGVPSLRLLYLSEINDTGAVVKAVGNQWYWQYDYPDLPSYDSYITSIPRLLEVDNRLFLPYNDVCRVLVTAADVLHSWTVPALGVKADAVPGRVNKLTLAPNRPGLYYGQCREICGRNHSFIPIRLECFFNCSMYFESTYLEVKNDNYSNFFSDFFCCFLHFTGTKVSRLYPSTKGTE